MPKNISDALVDAKLAVAELKKHSNGTVSDNAVLALARLIFEAMATEPAAPSAPDAPAPGQPS